MLPCSALHALQTCRAGLLAPGLMALAQRLGVCNTAVPPCDLPTVAPAASHSPSTGRVVAWQHTGFPRTQHHAVPWLGQRPHSQNALPIMVRHYQAAASQTVLANPGLTAHALEAPSSTRLGSQRLHTRLLQDLVTHPSLDHWDTFTELLEDQVPARLASAQQQLQTIMDRLQASHPSTDITPLLAVVIASCQRLQKESHLFLEHCKAPRCPIPVHRPTSHGEAMDQVPLSGDALELAGCTDAAAPGLAFAVAQATHHLRLWVDAESQQVVSGLRQLTERPGWWDQHPDVIAALDSVMDAHMTFTLTMRVLLGEALCCWGRLRRAHGLRGMGFLAEEEGADGRRSDRWSMAGPRHPPGHEDNMNKEPASLILPDAPLVELLTLATENTRAFCIEKNSMAPDVEVLGDPGIKVTCIDSYVEHIYNEVLKNAMQALIAKHGAWDVDEAEPIQVSLQVVPWTVAACSRRPHPPTPIPSPAPAPTPASSTPDATTPTSTTTADDTAAASGSSKGSSACEQKHLCITITDTGGGLPPEKLERCKHWFSSTHAPRRSGYGYSRDHGSQFQGLGVGMPLSRVYAGLMGGRIQWEVDREVGTTCVRLCLPCDGFSF